ncbi:MAG: 50S ribosomal protein L9 [Alphaproteobacteria bacterium]
MQVILLERIERLGNMGDVVNVKPGFARNFLLPKKKALRATDENRAHFERQRAALEAANKERREAAGEIAGKIHGISVLLIRQAGETGQLYGSVSARDIADAVTAAGTTVGRQQVLLDRPIKTLGLYPVRIALHPEVIESVTINVARNEEEAERQARGEVITGAPTEEEAPPELTAPPASEGEGEAEAAPKKGKRQRAPKDEGAS